MVPQEPTPLPVRPRLDFGAGPVTGADLATGQIPVIDPQPGQMLQTQPLDQLEETDDDPERRAPAGGRTGGDHTDDDAAWTASLKLPQDDSWGKQRGSTDWNYPQIFGPDDAQDANPGFADQIPGGRRSKQTRTSRPEAGAPAELLAEPQPEKRTQPRSTQTGPEARIQPQQPETRVAPKDSSQAKSSQTSNISPANAAELGPPTSPTTALPLRRELREQNSEPAPKGSRGRKAAGVIKRALGRRENRPHRGSADRNTLGARFSPRTNHLGLMRLLLALVVGFTHAAVIGYGWQPMVGHAEIGELCVDAFFVLSGFLLVGSYLRLDSVRRYAWHRFLRIMPGFWVCLVVSATLIAPLIAWLQDQPMSTLLTGQDSAVDYVIRNAALLMRQWGISGLPSDVEVAGVLNGSLWTLFYEAACYTSIILLGVFGGLRRRPVMTLGAVGALWIVTVLNDYQIMYIGQERILRLSFMFLIGSVLYLYAHQVPINRLLTVLAGGVLVAGVLLFDDYRVIAGPAFGYILMAVAVSRVKVWEPRTDISYGLYVYHWPLLQVFNLLGLTALSIWVYAPAGMAVAAVVALLSWKLVEKPALGFKDAGWVTWKLPVARPAASEVRA